MTNVLHLFHAADILQLLSLGINSCVNYEACVSTTAEDPKAKFPTFPRTHAAGWSSRWWMNPRYRHLSLHELREKFPPEIETGNGGGRERSTLGTLLKNPGNISGKYEDQVIAFFDRRRDDASQYQNIDLTGLVKDPVSRFVRDSFTIAISKTIDPTKCDFALAVIYNHGKEDRTKKWVDRFLVCPKTGLTLHLDTDSGNKLEYLAVGLDHSHWLKISETQMHKISRGHPRDGVGCWFMTITVKKRDAYLVVNPLTLVAETVPITNDLVYKKISKASVVHSVPDPGFLGAAKKFAKVAVNRSTEFTVVTTGQFFDRIIRDNHQILLEDGRLYFRSFEGRDFEIFNRLRRLSPADRVIYRDADNEAGVSWLSRFYDEFQGKLSTEELKRKNAYLVAIYENSDTIDYARLVYPEDLAQFLVVNANRPEPKIFVPKKDWNDVSASELTRKAFYTVNEAAAGNFDTASTTNLLTYETDRLGLETRHVLANDIILSTAVDNEPRKLFRYQPLIFRGHGRCYSGFNHVVGRFVRDASVGNVDYQISPTPGNKKTTTGADALPSYTITFRGKEFTQYALLMSEDGIDLLNQMMVQDEGPTVVLSYHSRADEKGFDPEPTRKLFDVVSLFSMGCALEVFAAEGS